VKGVSTNQCFGPDDPMTLSLMSDPHQKDVWAQIQNSVDNCPQQEDFYGEDDKVDQPTLEDFIKDMAGFALKELSGNQYDADAYLGSYKEQWWVTNGNSETFYVRDVITLDKFAHPEVLTHHLVTNINSWAPWLGIGLLLGPNAFRPQTLTFEWVENRELGVLS
jgi:hypothetical protein